MMKIKLLASCWCLAVLVLSCANAESSDRTCQTAADCDDGSGSEFLCKNNTCELKGSSSSSETEYDRVPIGGYCDLALECNDGTGGKYECVNKSCVKLVPKSTEDENSEKTDDPSDGTDDVVGKTCSSASDCTGTGSAKYDCIENKCVKDTSQTTNDPNSSETSAKCGDGIIDKDLGEVCDKTELGGMKCTELGKNYYSGVLKCADNCVFDESDCRECDPMDLASHGCGTGKKCQDYHCVSDGDSSSDEPETEKTLCGNGVIDSSAKEVCDGTNLDNKKCASIDEKYYSGILSCAPTCLEFDITQCFECDPMDSSSHGCEEGKICKEHHCVPQTCGNGTKDDGEWCDGEDLGGKTCDDLVGYKGGTLKCFATCSFDTSLCEIDMGSKSCSSNDDCSSGYTCESGECKAEQIECDPMDEINHPCPNGKTCKNYVCV